MFANPLARGPKRRGIVLVLILGMLGLLALIGVTFATYAGQAVVNARNFNISEGRSSAEAYMDFALGQLINDTNNPLSAIRGHSLLRDMYGNDSVFRGTTGADFGGLLSTVTLPNGQTNYLTFVGNPRPYTQVNNALTPALAQTTNRPILYYQYATNIPTAAISYQYYGLNFTRWIVKIQNGAYNSNIGVYTNISQTFEVIEDDDRGTDPFHTGYHLLTLSPLDGGISPNGPVGGATYLYSTPNQNGAPGQSGNGITDKQQVVLGPTGGSLTNTTFVLDGRYMNSFNGPGMSRALVPVPNPVNGQPFPPLVPFNVAAYANFKVNSNLTSPGVDPTRNFPSIVGTPPASATNPLAYTTFGNPDFIGMDEDYDACDLENWFLALQSADGQVMIPSFHRPSILTAKDWTSSLNAANLVDQMNAVAGIAKILRPRQIDNAPQFPPDPSTPDPVTGKITYDVDNDGDGVTDSVWLDLGYPVQRDPGGKLYKPLFAFMVIGQNGRMPLNTVGNLQDRDSQSSVMYYAKNPGGSGPHASPANNYIDNTGAFNTQANSQQQFATASTYLDAPTWDHTSHVGASVNEINPKFALQNAPANVYNPNVNTPTNNGTNPILPTVSDIYYSQVDYSPFSLANSALIDVSLTQLRNILAGTIPMNSLKAPNLAGTAYVQEGNAVRVGNQDWWMPNGVLDPSDPNYSTGIQARTGVPPVAGRWGEPEGIPQYLTVNNTIFSTLGFTPYVYNNPVRAGRSYYNGATVNSLTSYQSTADLMDDDLDSASPLFNNNIPENATLFDAAGQFAVPSQRMRRFSVPLDISGNGQLTRWMTRPYDTYSPYDANISQGADDYGRMSFFRYFRPPGMPQDTTYRGVTPTGAQSNDLYKMPVFAVVNPPRQTNNQFHSFEAFRAPAPNNTTPGTYTYQDLSNIATMAAMPFDIANGADPSMLWENTPPTLASAALGNGGTAPFVTYASSESGPLLLGLNSTVPTPLNPNPGGYPYTNFAGSQNGPYLDNPNNAGMATVANGYPLGSLAKDEADEMNLYNPNRNDQQFGPSDLEWLYRLQDVDGSTLNSRLSSLAPVSFLNPADGQTRRRLFSVDSWEPNNFVWANDNPLVFNTAAYLGNLTSSTPLNPFNSRFAPYGNSSFANLNQVVSTDPIISHFANTNSVEVLPNPLLDPPIISNSAYTNDVTINPNPDYGQGTGNYYYTFGQNPLTIPATMTSGLTNQQVFFNPVPTTVANAASNSGSPYYPNLINGQAGAIANTNTNSTAYPINTPALAHRDRRINLNMPLPIASDPAEPVRQKWCRETYQLLKAILPPQSIDTPQELAALSQFVVNIIDFRDPDATMTRFVNTDLMITPATATTPTGVKFAEIPVLPGIQSANITDPVTGAGHYFFPFDPQIAVEQTNPSPSWVTAMTDPTGSRIRPLYLVQYGMEYNPIAINEVLAYSFFSTPAAKGMGGNQHVNNLTPRFYVELVNTLQDDSSHAPLIPTTAYTAFPQPTNSPPTGTIATVGSGDLNLAGWDFMILPDTDARGRPDPTTGNVQAVTGLIAAPAYQTALNSIDVTLASRIDNLTAPTTTNPAPFPASTVPASAALAWGSTLPGLPTYSFGWSLDPTNGLWVPPMGTGAGNPKLPDGQSSPTNTTAGQVTYIPALRPTGPVGNSSGYGWPVVAPTSTTAPSQVIGDGYFLLGATPVFTNGAVDRVTAVQTSTGAGANAFVDFLFPNGFLVDVGAKSLTQPAPTTGPPPTPTPPTLPPGNQYYWLYLRRPANPFNPSHEMVVVDSFRFLFIVNDTQGQTMVNAAGTYYDQFYGTAKSTSLPASLTPPSGMTGTTSNVNEIFSLQRLQPYRGGHHVAAMSPGGDGAPLTGTGAVTPSTQTIPRGHVWGYTEQTTPVVTPSAGAPATAAAYGPNAPATSTTTPMVTYNNSSTTYFNPAGLVYDTLGYANNPNDGTGMGQLWDFFPFHDRDFNSVAELMLVPGCPPGLFTKAFSEQAFNFTQAANANKSTLPTATGTSPFLRTAAVNADLQLTYPHSFPYLPDKFFYTAVSVNPSTDLADPASAAPYPTQLGGWTGTGWYKMFDFFEVPSTANGAIGTADAGENFDWFRQDRRPGLLNLNLIIDEEVFFGLLDDPRINMALAQYGYYLNNLNYGYTGTANKDMPAGFPLLPTAATLPQIISQVDYFGNPLTYYSISDIKSISDTTATLHSGSAVTSLVPGGVQLQVAGTPTAPGAYYLLNTQIVDPGNNVPAIYPNQLAMGRGFSYADPAFSYKGSTQNLITGMKAAFADFVKLRHGGTNFLFGHQAPSSPPGMLALAMNGSPMVLNGVTPTPNSNNVWPDKPYRSFSYPDINYTVMRPATPVPPITINSGVSVAGTAAPYTINGTATNAFPGYSPLTFPPPYQYQFDPTATLNNSPIQSMTLPLMPVPGTPGNNLSSPNLPVGGTGSTVTASTYILDPGIRFPWMDLTFTNLSSYTTSYTVGLGTPAIPPIPPRRLFQPPDNNPTTATGYPGDMATTWGDLKLNGAAALPSNFLADPFAQLIAPSSTPSALISSVAEVPSLYPASAYVTGGAQNNFTPQPPNTTPYNPSLMTINGGPYLGANYIQQNFSLTSRREHPYYRTELLQKVMNLTTVRTHQFAVWITVGFFEVSHVGTPELGLPDILGAELDAAAGRNVRYRSFFVIDRTKATGFNPYYPGEFRNCVTYRRRIE